MRKKKSTLNTQISDLIDSYNPTQIKKTPTTIEI